MRYGAVATKLTERIAIASGRVPVPILDALVPLVQTRALMAAVRFGVFEALRGEALTSADVAGHCTLDAECTRLLLRVLCFAGYVKQRGSTFALTKLARRTMLRGAPVDASAYMLFNYTQWGLFDHFERVLQSGHGVDLHQALSDEAQGYYMHAMVTMARMLAPIVAGAMPIKSGAKTLLDIGGSHGLYAAAIAQRHGLAARVLDLADTTAHREAFRRELGDANVAHIEGDARTADLGTPDAVLIANLLHHSSESDAKLMVQRAATVLTSGGTLAIWEAEQPRANAKADYVDALTLYFKLTSTGQCYEGETMERWLHDAGLTMIKAQRSIMAPGFVLVSGTKP